VYVQFKNVQEGCFLSARPTHNTNPEIENRHPIESVQATNLSTIWLAEVGLYPQDYLGDKAVVGVLWRAQEPLTRE
jgi:hypothetical protein